MRFRDNLELYVLAGALVYLVRTLNLEELLLLIEHIFIGVVIGKTIEIALAKLLKKIKLSFVMSIVLSNIIVVILLLIMKKVGLVGNVLEVLPISIGISIFMVIVVDKRYRVYNEKLEKFKKELERQEDENN